jgi:hypothetical protein
MRKCITYRLGYVLTDDGSIIIIETVLGLIMAGLGWCCSGYMTLELIWRSQIKLIRKLSPIHKPGLPDTKLCTSFCIALGSKVVIGAF